MRSTSPSDLAVQAHGLTRTFGTRTAIEAVTFDVARGEIVALLGPNGAGKTTLLRTIAGLIAPSDGRVAVTGAVGVLTEEPGLWDQLSVALNLETYARLHGLDAPRDRVASGLAALGLADRARDRAGRLSKGLRQRVALARALLHDPAIVMLDEPTSGLDPASARQVRNLIAALAAEGRAVIVCTHNLVEAEELAHRIGVLNVRLLAIDTPEALRRFSGEQRVTVDVQGPAAPWAARVPAHLATRLTDAGSRLDITLASGAAVPDLVAALAAAGARIERVAPLSRTLEDAYLAMTGVSNEVHG